MQTKARYTLNAIKVFEAVARLGSVKKAGAELSVTAGAVSHQIKSLEDGLGALLFHRSHNAIRLTAAGQGFYERIQPAVASIESAAQQIQTDSQHLTIRVPVSLAVRWLIPKLEAFKQRYPDARIKLETSHNSEIELASGIDIAITYAQKNTINPVGKLLLQDCFQPLASPALLSKHQYRDVSDLKRLPALTGSTDNWDWHHWIKHCGLDISDINIVDQFDTDDAVMHAALAGMGMTLMSFFLTQSERQSGRLLPLPGTHSVQLGGYYLLSSQKSNRLKNAFEAWLFEQDESVPTS